MNNLLAAITSRVTTGPSNFYNDIGGRFYLDQAPEDRQFPDCVFLIVYDTPDNVFNKHGEEVSIQFSLFSASSGPSEISTMYTDLKALFDDSKLTVTSSTMIIMQRERLVTFMDDIITKTATRRVKVWNVDYSITLQNT
jgi:hypothetical protein